MPDAPLEKQEWVKPLTFVEKLPATFGWGEYLQYPSGMDHASPAASEEGRLGGPQAMQQEPLPMRGESRIARPWRLGFGFAEVSEPEPLARSDGAMGTLVDGYGEMKKEMEGTVEPLKEAQTLETIPGPEWGLGWPEGLISAMAPPPRSGFQSSYAVPLALAGPSRRRMKEESPTLIGPLGMKEGQRGTQQPG